MVTPIVLALPFEGRWRAINSPARRVPSHGTHLMGTTYAIDFVAVDERGRTASRRDWRTALGTEPPERFIAFSQPILAPVDGTIVAVHDGEADHEARRSPLILLGYMLGQAGRVRSGVAAVAGNHVIIEMARGGAFVGLVHSRSGTIRVSPGEKVTVGSPLAECGNSGNSTQPHVHVQVTDGVDMTTAAGLPIAFRDYRTWSGGVPVAQPISVPAESAVVESTVAT